MQAVSTDWREADLDARDRALCGYAEKLTRRPWEMTAADVQGLRDAGFDDVAIHDAIQVISYFNYINRVADAAHVDLEPEMEPYPGEAPLNTRIK
ncbi:MAG: hypothetical protein O7B99_04095 [Planctomycetota bacterium]|nr:hypothetical protein [Planctomycetota bacterium]